MSDDNPYTPPDSEISVQGSSDLASRWARLGGAIIDSIIAGVLLVPIMSMTGYWDQAMAGEQSFFGTLMLGLFGLLVFIVLHGYLLANHGQTIGKRLVGTRIVSVKDEKLLPLWTLIGLRYLPISVVAQIPLLGNLAVLADVLFIFRGDKRCIHDLIAGTKVVKA